MSKDYTKEYMLSLYKEDIDDMISIQKIKTDIRSRVDNIRAYAEISGYKKIGIAYCVSFTRQAEKLEKILEHDFEIEKVNCKVGRISKVELLGEGQGTACNPILQAEYLNDRNTDLNIVMGLCVGHDILFTKYSKAASTTLLVKDEVNNNEPVKGFI